MEVPAFFGISQPIDRNVLAFTYNGVSKACTVRIIPSEELLFPAVGQVVVVDPKIKKNEDIPDYQKLKKGDVLFKQTNI